MWGTTGSSTKIEHYGDRVWSPLGRFRTACAVHCYISLFVVGQPSSCMYFSKLSNGKSGIGIIARWTSCSFSIKVFHFPVQPFYTLTCCWELPRVGIRLWYSDWHRHTISRTTNERKSCCRTWVSGTHIQAVRCPSRRRCSKTVNKSGKVRKALSYEDRENEGWREGQQKDMTNLAKIRAELLKKLIPSTTGVERCMYD